MHIMSGCFRTIKRFFFIFSSSVVPAGGVFVSYRDPVKQAEFVVLVKGFCFLAGLAGVHVVSYAVIRYRVYRVVSP